MKSKSDKRKEAEARQKEHDKLSAKERMDKLDNKLGRGVGAKKEREKILKTWISL